MFPTEESTITDYLNQTFTCTCNKDHSVFIHQIYNNSEALHFLPELISSNGFKKSFFLYDETTYAIAGNQIEFLMKQSLLPYSSYIIKNQEPTPDERTLGEALIHYDPACDFIIAVGSGTLNDLSRFLSYKLRLPYMIVATAPSMDGYASNVAPLIVNHMKTTYEAHVPFAILSDTTIQKDAPLKMIAAGVGDILGKYTCLCDWSISHCINKEYHCEEIETLVNRSIETVVSGIRKARERDPEAIQSIMEALVLSGIAMSFVGNSRPASGSEHHLSHYWEMMFLYDGKQPILHGTKVGIGTIAVIKAYEILFSREIDFQKAEQTASQYSFDNWCEQMKVTYKEASASVIALENEIEKNSPKNVLPRLKLIENNWNTLKELASRLPSSDYIKELLQTLEAPTSPMSVGIDKTTFINSFIVAKELRNRYGLLQILFDLGITQEIAEEVWEYINMK